VFLPKQRCFEWIVKKWHTRRLVGWSTIHILLPFSFSARKNFLDDYFSRTFNPPNLTKLTRKWWPNTGPYPDMVLSGRLTHQRIWRWSKEANLGGLQLPNLTVHDGHFEPTVEFFPGWIKGQDLSLIKKNIPFSPPLIRVDSMH
jgi:hypothetical protein